MDKRVVCAQRLEDADVAVIGGGTAGCFAAIAAAASGARTVLIEKNAALGGTITTGGVNYPGLFYAWGQQIIDGPCWRVIQEVAQLGGAVIPDMNQPIKTHWKMQIRLNPFLYEQAVYRMCREYQVKISAPFHAGRGHGNRNGRRNAAGGKGWIEAPFGPAGD